LATPSLVQSATKLAQRIGAMQALIAACERLPKIGLNRPAEFNAARETNEVGPYDRREPVQRIAFFFSKLAATKDQNGP